MLENIKKDVSYNLDQSLRLEIISVKELIISNLQDIDIYLFGSIAKGCYSSHSDIDILILIHDNKSVRELRKLRHFFEDEIEKLLIDREVDLKVYYNCRFKELAKVPSFENIILNDLIDIRRW